MVRVIKKQALEDGYIYEEIACLSTDDKPSYSGLATGSIAIEVDTGDAYLYNEEADSGSEWVKVGGVDE